MLRVRRPDKSPYFMHKSLLLVIALLAGCASFNTKQVDERKLDDGSYTKISTIATSRTFFSSKSDLAKFKAIQTEGSQSASVGNLGQSATGTNIVQALQAIDNILGKVR